MKIGSIAGALAALGLATTVPAYGASQGQPGSTQSQGDFVIRAAGPATARNIQVLNLSDVDITNSTTAEIGSGPGKTMSFCVVDNYAASVALQMSSNWNPIGADWALYGPGGAGPVLYKIVVQTVSGSALFDTSNPGGPTASATLTGSQTVLNTGSCGSSGTTKAHVLLNQAMPSTLPSITYTGTITVLLTAIY